jgi:ATP-dependent Clp protease adaptor protein ClpS
MDRPDFPIMSQTFVQPELIDSGIGSGRWMVLIYDNESNSFDEVIGILMRSTGCGTQEAYFETWEAHTYGKAPVHFSSQSECEVVAAMVASIGVKTQVRREWNEE